MCGICGYKDTRRRIQLDGMMNLMTHRGPDQEGTRSSGTGQWALGHRRLSIVDLSDAGRQPMANESGSIFLVHNGEIYNHLELKADLISRGHRFKSRSDSEVILHAYEEYGTDCVTRLNGMFAFAVYDEDQDLLFLARDRFGIKPCYYMRDGAGIVFASEIKPLLWCQEARSLNPHAVYSLLTFQFSTDIETVASGIYNLPPGHFMVHAQGHLNINRYYDITNVTPVSMNRKEAADRVRELLTDSVRIRLMGDVSSGVMLSGGLDSSAVVACAAGADARLNTYTVGFGSDTDEYGYARQVASTFQTDHFEFEISPLACLDRFENIAYHADLPLAESGLIPIFLISECLKERHKILLFGEGSDEYMAGYPWHRLGSPLLSAVPQPVLERAFFMLISQYHYRRNGHAGYNTFKSLFPKTGRNFLERIIRFELHNRLPHNHLLKIDRMTMAHSIEGRVPFLDHRLVELVYSLNASCKLNGFNGKMVLKAAMAVILPSGILDRRKVGFPFPLVDWFRNELKDFCRSLITSNDSISHTLFPEDVLRRLLQRTPLTPWKQIKTNSLLTRLVFLELWHKTVFKGGYLAQR